MKSITFILILALGALIFFSYNFFQHNNKSAPPLYAENLNLELSKFIKSEAGHASINSIFSAQWDYVCIVTFNDWGKEAVKRAIGNELGDLDKYQIDDNFFLEHEYGLSFVSSDPKLLITIRSPLPTSFDQNKKHSGCVRAPSSSFEKQVLTNSGQVILIIKEGS